MGLSSALLCLSVGASALSLQRAPLRSAKRAPTRGRVTMEDFGIMAGTKFSFRDEWAADANSGKMLDCISEVKIEKYMNEQGLRHKMNKTQKERDENNLKLGGERKRQRGAPERRGLRRSPEAARVSARVPAKVSLGTKKRVSRGRPLPTQSPPFADAVSGGIFPEFSFTIPLLNVVVNIGPPETESIWEALGFTATSNNEARQLEKKKSIKKEKEAYEKYDELTTFWREKYGYTKYVPGSWFYADQLTTDDDELRSTSGFRMRKGGFYPDGSRDTRK